METTTEQLNIGQEYEIKGYPMHFPEVVRGVYLGKGKRTHYFASNRVNNEFVAVDARFAKVKNKVESTRPISSFATFRFRLDELRDGQTRSELIKILENSGGTD